MHPAFSVIFFTTLSGAGYGLLICSAIAAVLRWAGARALLACMALGLVLVTVGLLSSMAHLGKPLRAWRAFSQWRTSWLSREGVMAIATYVPALGVVAMLLPGMLTPDAEGTPVMANALGVVATLALVACALVTVACTAMIYASLKPVPAWRHAFVVPVYLLFSLLTGGLLCGALVGLDGPVGNSVAMGGIVAAIGVGVLKWRYWHDIDTTPLSQTRADAVCMPGRDVSVFERLHTESSYLTREMGFVLARRHSRRLGVIATVLFAAIPTLLMLPVWLFR